MFRKNSLSIFFGVFLLFISGCASLNSSIPFQYQPSLISSAKKIDKSVGINMFVDARPDKDKSYTKSIKDLPEKVTSKILEDFETSKLFKNVNFPASEKDDIVIDGKIKRFMWQYYSKVIAYTPFVYLGYLGVPMADAYSITELSITVKDNKTGKIFGKFTESSEIKTPYTVYNFKAGEAGTELAETFRDVVKALKEDILSNANFE